MVRACESNMVFPCIRPFTCSAPVQLSITLSPPKTSGRNFTKIASWSQLMVLVFDSNIIFSVRPASVKIKYNWWHHRPIVTLLVSYNKKVMIVIKIWQTYSVNRCSRRFRSRSTVFKPCRNGRTVNTSRIHTNIILTSLNPTFIL